MDMDSHEHAPTVGSLRWSTPSHVAIKRTVDWYWALGIIALCGVGLSIWLGDTLFAAVIALAAVIIGIMSTRAPREYDVIIDDEGVVVDHERYLYESLRGFWIETEGVALPMLYVSTKALLHPHLIVLLPSEEHAEEARELLEMYLPEEMEHSVGTTVARLFGW